MLASSRIGTPSAVAARPPAFGVDASRRADDRRAWCGRARELLARSDRDHLAGGAVDRRPSARPAPARWRCAGRRPPARRASAPGSRCDTSGCRRRSRSRAPCVQSTCAAIDGVSSSAIEHRATRRARAAGRAASPRPCAGSSAAGRRGRRRRPGARAGTDRRTRRTPRRTRANTCCTAHSALTRCSRTMSAARGTSIGSSSISSCASKSDASSGPRRARCGPGCRCSCSRDRAAALVEPLAARASRRAGAI